MLDILFRRSVTLPNAVKWELIYERREKAGVL